MVVEVQRHRTGPPIRVALFGPQTTSGRGRPLVLSERRRALLAALVAADRPLDRGELIEAVGIGRSTLNPMLSRLATEDLGLPGPIHRQVDRRQGRVELDPSLIGSDVDDIRKLLSDRRPLGDSGAATLADLRAFRPPDPLGLVGGTTLATELDELLVDLARRAATTLGQAGLAGSLERWPLAGHDPSRFDDPLLLAAHFDHLAEDVGVDEARRILDGLAEDRPSGDHATAAGPRSGHGSFAPPGLDLARLVITTHRNGTRDRKPSGGLARSGLGQIDEITRALQSDSARVVVLGDTGVGPDRVVETVRALRRRFPAVIGGWVSPASRPVAALAALIGDLVAQQLRRPGSLRPRLVTALAAVADDRPLEPASTARWFTRDVAAALRSWTDGEQPVLVVGRPTGPAPGLDRILTDLLRLDPGLRLVVMQPGPAAELDPDGLAGLSRLDLTPATNSSPAVTHGPASRSSATIDEHEGRRFRAVVARASDDGRLNRDLARHLLDLVGATPSIDQLLAPDANTGAIEPDDTSSPLSPDDRRWLDTEAVRWLLADRLVSPGDVALLRRLLDRLPDHTAAGTLLAGLPASLIGPADLAFSHGDHQLAVSLIDLALDHSRKPGRPVLLLRRGDLHRDLGRWDLALVDYLEAVDLVNQDDSESTVLAELALRAARLTWDPETGNRVDQILTDALGRLPDDEPVWRARIELCQAGGSFQDGSAGANRQSVDDIEATLEIATTALEPSARAWALIHARKAVLGVMDVDRSCHWAERIVGEAHLDVAILAHGHQALFVDHVRRGDWTGAEQALRRLNELARTPTSAEQRFSAVVAQTCWDLQAGRTADAEAGLAAEQGFAERLGGSTFTQVTLAHSVWLARIRGDRSELETLAAAAAAMAEAEPGGEIWMAGAALLATDVGQYQQAATRAVEFARPVGGFRGLRPGAHRLGVLAISAWAAGLVAASGAESPFTGDELDALIDGLGSGDASIVLIGWPTVILGPVARFRAMALAARGRLDEAEQALATTADLDRGLGPMESQAAVAARAVANLRTHTTGEA